MGKLISRDKLIVLKGKITALKGKIEDKFTKLWQNNVSSNTSEDEFDDNSEPTFKPDQLDECVTIIDPYHYLSSGLAAINDGTDEEALYYLNQVPNKLFSLIEREPIEKMPLHNAIQKGMLKTAKMLIEEKKINVNLPADVAYETPLILATKNKQKEIVALLLKHGAQTDIIDLHNQTAKDYGLSLLMTSDDNQADIVGKNSMIENSESF